MRAGWLYHRRRQLVAVLRRAGREPVAIVLTAALTIILGIVAITNSSVIPVSVMVVPLLLGGLFLSPATLWATTTMAGVFVLGGGIAGGFDGWFGAEVVVIAVVATVAQGMARSRARLGLQGTMGESMLVDLRDRLAAHGELPPLPRGWQIEAVQRSGGRTSFSGDFVVSARPPHGIMLELAVVDVSGKGHDAGARALQLSGAFGGLLGSLPPPEFLPAANAYLLRQRWSEGFATAVHLVIDLTSGRFEVRSAGHPPAIRFHAGSGRWETLDATGGLLGVLEKDSYDPVAGQLASGDAMLLYTDGVVEAPRRVLADGIDKLAGEAERLVARSGFRNGARKLIDAVASSDADDRALVLLWRS